MYWLVEDKNEEPYVIEAESEQQAKNKAIKFCEPEAIRKMSRSDEIYYFYVLELEIH